MSTSTENTTPGVCEQVLDYAYDELSGDAKAAFEQHLQTCAKCLAELAQLKRVRGAVKAVLPSVEPPANATGALHAQLLHAAAQRAGGGKVIPFGRRVQKVMMSPAFLAAAMFLIVGGAAGTMWWRGHILMPERAAVAPVPEATTIEAPPGAPPPPVVTAMPAAPAAAGDEVKTELPKAEAERGGVREKKKELDVSREGYFRDAKAAKANEGGEAENKVFLGGISKDSAPMPVRRAPPTAHANAKGAAEKPSFALPAADKPADLPEPAKKAAKPPAESSAAVKTRKMDNAALDGLSDDISTNGRGSGGASVGGVVGSTGSAPVDSRSRLDQGVKTGKTGGKRQEVAPQGGGWNGNVSSVPPKASSAPAAAPAPAMQQSFDGKPAGPRSSTNDSTWKNTTGAKEQRAIAAPSTQAAEPPPAQNRYGGRDYGALRKQALDYADSGRCPEAIKVFEEMQKARWSLSSKETLAYKRCKARVDEASKQDRNFQNRMMQDAEQVNEESVQKAPAKPAPAQQNESQAVKSSPPAKAKKRPPAADQASDPAETKSGL